MKCLCSKSRTISTYFNPPTSFSQDIWFDFTARSSEFQSFKEQHQAVKQWVAVECAQKKSETNLLPWLRWVGRGDRG